MPVGWNALAPVAALAGLIALAWAVKVLAGWLLLRRDRKYLKQLAELRGSNNELQCAVEQLTRQHAELFEGVEGYLRQRDEWQQLYYQQASEHGTAQEMMLAERARLLHQLGRAKITPRTNAVIDSVAGEFEQQHAGPARDALARRAAKRVGTRLEDQGSNGQPEAT